MLFFVQGPCATPTRRGNAAIGGGHEIRPVEKVLPSLEVCSMFLAIYS